MRTLLKRSRLLVASTLALFTACSASEAPRRGQLMVAVATDMSVPKDVSHIRIKIKLGAEVRWEFDYQIAPDGEFHLPGTLAVVEGSTANPVVSVEVIGIRTRGGATEARTFSKSVTTIPRERTLLLRVPVQWLCDETVLSDGDGGYLSACEPLDGDETACRAGGCERVAVDPGTLPDFDPTDVFGGGRDPSDPLARCFDTLGCFDRGVDVPVGDLGEGCTLTLEDDGEPLNVGLHMNDGGDGICHGDDGDEPPCYVPLDQDDLWGWRYDDNAPSGMRTVQLPPGVCTALENDRFAAVRVTTACETKTGAYHTCGPWSAITGSDAGSGAGGSTGEGGSATGGGGTSASGGSMTSGGSTGMAGEGGDATGGSAAGSAGDSSGGAGGAGSDGVVFMDANLEGAVRGALGMPSGAITPQDAAGLTALNAMSQGISDISGLEFFVGLNDLLLNNNNIQDISPIANLDQLINISFTDNPVVDISAVEQLPNLADVDFINCPLGSITPIANNLGLNSGESLNITGVGAGASCADIATLQARGVTVFYNNGCP